MFEITSFKVNNGQLDLELISQTKVKSKNVNFEVRFKDMERFVVGAFNEYFSVPMKKKSDRFILSLPLESITSHLPAPNMEKQIVWFFIESDGQYFECKINEKFKKDVQEIKEIPVNAYFEMRLLYRGNKTLGLELAANPIKSNITFKEQVQNSLLFEVNGFIKNVEIPVNNFDVYLRKRTHKSILLYNDEVRLLHKKDNLFELPLGQFADFALDERTIFDFKLRVKEKNIRIETLCKTESIIKKLNLDSVLDLSSSELYTTASNTLALKIDRVHPSVHVEQCILDNQRLIIQINEKSLSGIQNSNIEAVWYRVNQLPNKLEDLVEFKKIEMARQNGLLSLNSDLSLLFEGIKTNYEQKYQLFLQVNKGNEKLLYNLSTNEKFMDSYTGDLTTSAITCEKNVSLSLKPTTSKSINLGILGTCFTRSAFNSVDPYFNKDYKNYFNIGYSYFWISLLSSVSEPIQYNRSNFSDIPDKVVRNIEREYSKTLFTELKNAKVDYLLIDFFVDALHGARKLKDGRYLGQNGDMHKSAYYKNHILKDTEQFDYRNPAFMSEWRKACDQFIDRLQEIIPLDKVILNIGGLTEEYFDAKGLPHTFYEKNQFVKKEITNFNTTWNRMNNYFLSKVPNAKVIDMNAYNYKSSHHHPISMGPHHFEHSYYKSLVAEIGKVITFTEQK
ncbi:DUF6270 domain-containing protein [Gottfriedia sp. NPDC056225]|uniref:DUF6270 domain-containing protein n=1 Tax=Gottfriedia sp. NPDC056225 TaxID=3345751 RepID=UPI001559AEF3|nr:hypothetical protein HPK19_20745 [Arthrobacter citreus]